MNKKRKFHNIANPWPVQPTKSKLRTFEEYDYDSNVKTKLYLILENILNNNRRQDKIFYFIAQRDVEIVKVNKKKKFMVCDLHL
jgi:hypothetical protein